MSSAGHIFDSIRRIRENREELKLRRERRDRLRKTYRETRLKVEKTNENTPLTPTERQKIRQSTLRTYRWSFAKRALALGLAVAVTFAIFWYLVEVLRLPE